MPKETDPNAEKLFDGYKFEWATIERFKLPKTNKKLDTSSRVN